MIDIRKIRKKLSRSISETLFRKSTGITTYTKNNINDNSNIKKQIKDIDSTISYTVKCLIQAQSIHLNTLLAKPRGLFQNISHSYYRSVSHKSIKWHFEELLNLVKLRLFLQYKLFITSGPIFLRPLRKLFLLLALGMIILSSIFILIIGFLALLNFLPLIIIIFCALFLFAKNKTYK